MGRFCYWRGKFKGLWVGGQPMMREKISIIGGGHMGGALIKGLTEGEFSAANVIVSDQDEERLEKLKKELKKEHSTKIKWTQNNRDAVEGDIVILAVPPRNVNEVLKEISQAWTDPNKLLISITAGVKCKDIERVLNKKVRIIRMMPNGPAEVGQGAIALYKGDYATKEDLSHVKEIFKKVGEITIIHEEEKMDAVTGLSGSGPAYVFWFIKALIKAGNEAGLSEEQSNFLAKQTVLGAAQIVKETKKSPDELIEMIATRGGTTEAALLILKEKSKLYKALIEAVREATDRSKKIGDEFHQKAKEEKK